MLSSHELESAGRHMLCVHLIFTTGCFTACCNQQQGMDQEAARSW